MKHVVTQLLRLVLALGVLYGALLVVTLLLVPRESDAQRIDTARAADTLYLTEPKYVFLARDRLATARSKVVLLGASNTMAGFKQRELQPLLPDVEVHNLAVGGANLTEVAQVAELVREVQPVEARRHTTYVLGLWYGLFASDRARWYTPDRSAGDTDIDIERYRYGFYRRTDAGSVPVVPVRYLDLGTALIHPYLVLDRTARDLTVSLRARLSGKAPKLNDEQRNARVISTDEQRNYLAFWQQYMGSVEQLEEQPFERLRAVVASIVADGGRVVLVDMPIPAWHAAGSRLDADYRAHMRLLFPALAALPGVTVLSMSDAGNDADFSDEVHPKPRVSPRWSARLAETLRITSTDTSASNPTARNDHG